VIRLTRTRVLLLSLAASALVLAVPPALSARVRLAAAGFFEPVTGTVRALGGGLRARLAAFGRGPRLAQELAEERRRRTELESVLAEKIEELARLRRARAEGDEARAALERARWRRGLPLAANVISRPGKWESHELVVDRGRANGVEPGCPVLAGEAALGIVADCAENTARVLVLGHPQVALPARLVETRQQGLVEASGSRLKLNHVVRDPLHPVEKDHTVVTSGLDGNFPPGCLIGRVGPGVGPAEGKPFYDMTVVLPQSASSPELVWILVRAAPGAGRGPR